VGSFIRIGPGIEAGEPSSRGGAPRGVVPGSHIDLRPAGNTYAILFDSMYAANVVEGN
jgi:hypothetical protein